TSTIGLAGERSALHSAGVAETSAVITAKGLAGRRFRSRRRLTAHSERASQASWYPPRLLMATTSPERSAATASSSGDESRGPQSQQAIGWAWKRRSRGSSYSRRHSAHIRNRRMVVLGRS